MTGAAPAAASPDALGGPAFWDCHAAIGRWTIPPPAGALDPRGLRAEMAWAGISGALVHHGLGRDYDPAGGNHVLLQELPAVNGGADSPQGDQTLVPCVTLLPPDTAEFPPLEDYLSALIRQGVRGVRLYPQSHNFSLEEWCAGALLAALERHRLPVSIDLAETNWSAIHGLCAAHHMHLLSHSFPSPAQLAALAAAYPDVTISVGHAASFVEPLPAYYDVCREHPNVYLDLCGSMLWRGLLEQMVAGAGAGRVLYGSDIPFVDPRGQLGRVAFARLPDDDLRQILGGNARRIWDRVSADGRPQQGGRLT